MPGNRAQGSWARFVSLGGWGTVTSRYMARKGGSCGAFWLPSAGGQLTAEELAKAQEYSDRLFLLRYRR